MDVKQLRGGGVIYDPFNENPNAVSIEFYSKSLCGNVGAFGHSSERVIKGTRLEVFLLPPNFVGRGYRLTRFVVTDIESAREMARIDNTQEQDLMGR